MLNNTPADLGQRVLADIFYDFINVLDCSFLGSSGDDRQSVAMKDLLEAIYPRSERPEYVVRLEPIQTTTKAVFQYLTTEEELARYPSHTPR